MTTLTLPENTLDTTNPAQRLRRQTAAVRVSFTWFGVHRTLNAQQKEEVGESYGADARLLSAGKKIIDVRHEAFRKLTSIRTRVVNYWRGLTLPYTEPGIRLIKQADIEPFLQSMERFREELVEAESELNTVYDQMKADAERRLGRLYNPYDYPVEIRSLFAVAWEFPSVEPPSYLMRLHPEIYQQEQERVAQRFDEAVRLAEQGFITEFARLVSHVTERLANDDDGQRRVFRDSVVTNLTEFFDRFQHLNVRSNGDLDQLVEEAQRLVRGVTPQDLRDNDSLRRQVATQMASVQSQLDEMIIDRPRRSIIRASPSRNGGNHAVAR
jgi:hypothetical protein